MAIDPFAATQPGKVARQRDPHLPGDPLAADAEDLTHGVDVSQDQMTAEPVSPQQRAFQVDQRAGPRLAESGPRQSLGHALHDEPLTVQGDHREAGAAHGDGVAHLRAFEHRLGAHAEPAALPARAPDAGRHPPLRSSPVNISTRPPCSRSSARRVPPSSSRPPAAPTLPPCSTAPGPQARPRCSSPGATCGHTKAATLSMRPASHHDPASLGPPSSRTVCTPRAARSSRHRPRIDQPVRASPDDRRPQAPRLCSSLRRCVGQSRWSRDHEHRARRLRVLTSALSSGEAVCSRRPRPEEAACRSRPRAPSAEGRRPPRYPPPPRTASDHARH